MMYHDEIIAEVWRNRDAYAARHHYSLDEMVADLRERQKRLGCKLVDCRDKGHKRILKITETPETPETQRPQV